MPKRAYEEGSRNEEDLATQVDPLFGQHQAFPVNRVPEERVQQLYSDKAQTVCNVDEYLSLVRYEAEMTEEFGYAHRDIKDQVGGKEKTVSRTTIALFEGPQFEAWSSAVVENYNITAEKYRTMQLAENPNRNTALPATIADWKALVVNKGPDLAMVRGLELGQQFKLISLFQRWCSKKINKNFIKWIFVTLSMIPDLISYDELAVLRAFAKKLSRLLSLDGAVTDENSLICYKWCVVIVAEVYHQRDLYIQDEVHK